MWSHFRRGWSASSAAKKFGVSVDIGVVGVMQMNLGNGQIARFLDRNIAPGGGVDNGEDTRSEANEFPVHSDRFVRYLG